MGKGKKAKGKKRSSDEKNERPIVTAANREDPPKNWTRLATE